MRTLIIYDSYFGCTKQIAYAIGKSFEKDVEVFHVNEVNSEKLLKADLLIMGSPTRGFRPTEAIQKFLKEIPAGSLKGIKVTAFDTRLELSTIKMRVFRYIVDKGGYAAKSILQMLEKNGGEAIFPPEGFLVMGEEGPLKEGETERATEWGKKVVMVVSRN